MWRLCSLSQGIADREDPCCGGGGELEIRPLSLALCEMADIPREVHGYWALSQPSHACFVAGSGAEGSAASAQP